MKHRNVLWSMLAIGMAAMLCVGFPSCSNDDNPSTPQNPDTPDAPQTEFSVNLDPTDFSIATIFSPEGDSIYIFGEKDEFGNPIRMSDVLITPHDGDGTTEILFDENKNPQKVIAPNGVVMLFEWLEEKKAALTLIDPNSEEQLNTVVNFSQDNNSSAETRSVQSFDRRLGKTAFSVVPIKDSPKGINSSTRAANSSSGQIGNLSVKQCNVETDAECWVDAYSYSGMPHSGLGTYVGRLKCVKKGTGEYQYILPTGIEGQHHDLSEHCDFIMDVLTGICSINNTLGPAYKESICTYITAALATGVVSVPVALGFEAACTALNVSLEIFCHTTPMQAAMYGDVGDKAFCGLIEEMHLEWDDPLVFVPTVNALPSNVTGIPKEWDGFYPLPDLEVSWGGQAQISQFVLEPAAPAHGQSYVATADLYCLAAGSIITLSIVGTDGYSDANVFVVGDEINYRATLNVPGAESGVKDVCTIKLELPDGSVKTKKASLVFQ